MKILLTGSQGFLGWHTRVRLRADTDHEVITADRANWADLPRLAKGADAIIHCAGVNRADATEVEAGNIGLAAAVGEAVRQGGSCPRIVYASSIQAGNDSPYGRGKRAAGELLTAAAAAEGGTYTEVRLPNIFGEHGRPNYNSFVATFVDALAAGRKVQVTDRPVQLLHAQDAAHALISGLTDLPSSIAPGGTEATVQGVFEVLSGFLDIYTKSDIPALTRPFDVDLFNTLRAALFPARYPMKLIGHTDGRGRLVETVRSHGGKGQAFISTTRPGVTRGEHFHLRKIERFVVVGGKARIRLRRMFTDKVVTFHVNGTEPVVVDMPTLWTHNITNTGEEDLTTMFWTHSLFDPSAPDTHHEPVEAGRER